MHYLISRCRVCLRRYLLYFRTSSLSGLFFLFCMFSKRQQF